MKQFMEEERKGLQYSRKIRSQSGVHKWILKDDNSSQTSLSTESLSTEESQMMKEVYLTFKQITLLKNTFFVHSFV